MKLENLSNIPSKRIREIIQVVKPSDVSNFKLVIKPGKPGDDRGTAYPISLNYYRSKCPEQLVTIRIGESKHYPIRAPGHDGHLPVDLYSREEVLVFIIAHELRHLWQAAHPKGWRVWGSRGQYSERDADAYGIRMLRKWRRDGNINADFSPCSPQEPVSDYREIGS